MAAKNRKPKIIRLNTKAFDALQTWLAMPPASNEGLQHLARVTPTWEQAPAECEMPL